MLGEKSQDLFVIFQKMIILDHDLESSKDGSIAFKQINIQNYLYKHFAHLRKKLN